MSTNQHIKTFLEALGFKSKNGIQYKKDYKLQPYSINADLNKGKIYYRKDESTTVEKVEDGQIQIGDKTTSNFTQPENFVVLECVDRLLNKGYLPNDIHLERRYPSGRGASGGKSDVCVYGKDGKSLMVIECKTYGSEYEKEIKKMDEHGGQLFAYLANDQNAKFLVLYASKLNDKNLFDYENLIVQIKDREEDLKKSTKQIEEENIKLYRDAKNKAELFEVWKESFNQYFHFNGIFDDDANAYSLELKALKKKNLKLLEDSQGLFNKFAEILRHNNISDNANAFNKILSLFLCKIVDEEKNDDDVLDFQVKEDEEYEHIIDRLQALYHKGMKKLNEEIIYYSEKELHEIIKLYPKQTPIESIETVFRELKYYTNNEFAFKEVHNKKLFEQNGRVLSEVIKLIQNFKFKYNSQQQVLGDFFELMLTHGVKQSEGQFFTPIPIVRYIILSLDFMHMVNTKIEKDEDYILPKTLDYACGAGHFLTESIEELQYNLQQLDTTKLSIEKQKKISEYRKGTEWTKDYTFGIEKDYRLARTSQIACYINGDGDANIIFGDGLEDHEQLKLKQNKFDVVIANPPYSVESFKNYLNVGKTHYTLFEHLTEKSSEIETIFIERTKQVLKNGGSAGIVLPISIFESGGIYEKARELILKHFEIKGITILGSKTFIATSVKTLVVFLKRRNDDFLKDREYITNDVFNGGNIQSNKRYIQEKRMIEEFCEFRSFEFDDYLRFLKIEINTNLAKTDIFTEYKISFFESTEVKNIKKKTYFKKYNKKKQEEELNKLFYNFCKEKEKEKFFFYMLCLNDADKSIDKIEQYYSPQQTVVVKTGKSVEEQKEFIGYEFSGRKRQEGIKINNYGGSLFDNSNYDNPEKAIFYNRKSFKNIEITNIDPVLSNNVQSHSLIDLIDFDQVDFDKKISSEIVSKTNWEDVWGSDKIVALSPAIVTVQKGSSITKTQTVNGKIPVVAGGQQPAYFHNVSNRPSNIITVSASGAYAGFVNFWDTEIFASDCTTIKSKNEKELPTDILYELLKVVQDELYKLQRGQAQPHVYPKDLSRVKIPVPNAAQRKKIINELNKLNAGRGEFLAKGTSIDELENLLSKKKKIIIKKICFDN